MYTLSTNKNELKEDLIKVALELLKEYWKSYPVKRDHLFVSLDVPHDPLKIR